VRVPERKLVRNPVRRSRPCQGRALPLQYQVLEERNSIYADTGPVSGPERSDGLAISNISHGPVSPSSNSVVNCREQKLWKGCTNSVAQWDRDSIRLRCPMHIDFDTESRRYQGDACADVDGDQDVVRVL
jgi:hypothetical protein